MRIHVIASIFELRRGDAAVLVDGTVRLRA